MFSLPVSAQEQTGTEIVGYVPSDILSAVPEEVRQYLPSSLEEAIAGNTDGQDSADFALLYRAWKQMSATVLRGAFAPFCTLAAYAVLQGMVLRQSHGFLGERTGSLIDYAAMLCLSLTVFSVLRFAWSQLAEGLRSVTVFVDALLPSIAVLYAAGGNTASGTISAAGTAAIIGFLENIIGTVLFPMLSVCYGFTVLDGMCDGIPFGAVGSWIRKCMTGILTAVMTAFSAVMTFQHTLAKSADSVLIRGIRYAAGNLIPMVGGAVSESMATLSAGLGYIRTGVGILGITVIVLILSVPLLTLFWYKLLLFCAGLICELTGGDKSASVLKQSGDILNFGIAFLAGAGMMFILVFVLFLQSAGI